MGFLDDIRTTIFTTYKMEVEGAKASVRSLVGVQKQAANEAVAAMERQHKAIELNTAKIMASLGAVAAGYAIAKRGVDAYEKSLEALGDKGTKDLERFRKAQAQANAATNQFEIALGRLVVAATPVIESLAQMATQLANIAGGVAAVVEKAKQLPGAGAVGTVLTNAWRALPQGQLITAGELGGDWLFGGGVDSNDPFYRRDPEAEARVLSRYADTSVPGSAYSTPQEQYSNRKNLEMIQARVDATIRNANRKGKRARRGARGGGGPAKPQLDLAGLGESALGYIGSGIDTLNQGLDDFGAMGTEWHPDDMDVMVSRAKASVADLAAFEKELLGQQQESMLERIFGPVSEFDAYAAGFNALQAASTAAFQAWIAGSGSVGKAAKDAAVQSLTASATQLLGEGLAAMGRGAIHMTNPVTAATGAGELATGAKAIAQAAAIGLLAKGLGGSVHVGAQGAGAGGGYGGSGGSGRQQDTDHRRAIIANTDDWADEGPRWRARHIERQLLNHDRYFPPPDGGHHG